MRLNNKVGENKDAGLLAARVLARALFLKLIPALKAHNLRKKSISEERGKKSDDWY